MKILITMPVELTNGEKINISLEAETDNLNICEDEIAVKNIYSPVITEVIK